MNNPALTTAVIMRMTGPPPWRTDRHGTALALRLARQTDCYDEVLEAILTARKEWRTHVTLTQRKWQTNVSRRPQRGNHHDSWTIRERYVRCNA